MGEFALIKGDPMVIPLHLRREHEVVVSTQKDGNLTCMRGGRGLREGRPLGRCWKREPGAIIQVFFNGGKFENFPIDLQLDLCCEDDLSLAGVGHDPDPGG